MSASAWNSSRQLRRSPIKTPPLRLPGQSSDERIGDLQDKFGELLVIPLGLVLFALFEWLRWWMAAPPSPYIALALMLIAILYALWKGAPLVPMIRNLQLGRDGERVVGQMLEELREKGYRVFHDIPGEDFNVDHVLVGPAGIFVIETKTRSKLMRGSGKVFYDGNAIRIEDRKPTEEPLVQARSQATWIVNLLNYDRSRRFAVRPVVVFPGWYVEQPGSLKREDVWVLNPKMLGGWLDREPRILSADAIDAVAHDLSQLCRRPTTVGE